MAELTEGIRAGRVIDEVLGFIRARLMRFDARVGVMQLSVPFASGIDSPLDGAMQLDHHLAEFIGALRSSDMMYALGLEAPKTHPSDLSSLAAVGPAAELHQFQLYGEIWRRLHAAYDVVIFYADSSMFAVTNGIRGYCVLEHGTIRAIPFEDSTYGRLVAEGYRQADHVFITNADYVTNKQRLEFRADQFVYLPHPFDEQRAFGFKAQFKSPEREADIVRFFCPARQDWRSRDPKMSKGNDAIFHAARALLDDGIGNFHLTCIAWGVDLPASMDLCTELGLVDHVSWVPPMTKRQLWEAMLSSDCIIDQFLISAMGGVTFEALALGRRLISRDDGVENKEFFGSAPPILSAAHTSEIASRMRQVVADPEDSTGIGDECMHWIAEYHSAKRNTALQMAAFMDVINKKQDSKHALGREKRHD